MGYVFRPVPGDLLAADVPQLSPLESVDHREQRLVGILLGTMVAVPAFRARVLGAIGAGGTGPMTRAEIYQDVHLPGRGTADENGNAIDSVPDGLIRQSGAFGRVAVLLEAKRHTFDPGDARHVRQIVKHLAQAKRNKIQKLLTISSIVPSVGFLQEVSGHPIGASLEKLRSLTWLGTLDMAYHLLERRKVSSAAEVYLLEQYIRYVKEEAVRDRRARTDRPEGAIFFRSLGEDWESLGRDFNAGRGVDARDPRLTAVSANWLAFVRYLSLMSVRGGRNEDTVVFPNVRAADPAGRLRAVARRLKETQRLSASFRKRREFMPVTVSVDFKAAEIHFQVEIKGPKEDGQRHTRALARLVQPGDRKGQMRLQIFWPGEKSPRSIALARALADPVATAPPQHGLEPDRFIIERLVPFGPLIANSESFVQLLAGEFRAFRVSVRHLLRRGLPS